MTEQTDRPSCYCRVLLRYQDAASPLVGTCMGYCEGHVVAAPTEGDPLAAPGTETRRVLADLMAAELESLALSYQESLRRALWRQRS